MTESSGFFEPAPAAEVQPEPAPEAEAAPVPPADASPPEPAPDPPFIPDQGVADWLRDALLYLHTRIAGK